MKTLLTTAAVALTLTAATAVFATPNRGTELARSLQRSQFPAYALTGVARLERKATPAQDRHPVQVELAQGRGAF